MKKLERRCIHATWLWFSFLVTFQWLQKSGLASSTFFWTFWSCGWAKTFLFREVSRYLGHQEFNSLHFVEALHASLTFVLEVSLFQSLLNIRVCTTSEGWNKNLFANWNPFGAWKLQFCRHGTIKLKQCSVCFANLCINIFVLHPVTRE